LHPQGELSGAKGLIEELNREVGHEMDETSRYKAKMAELAARVDAIERRTLDEVKNLERKVGRDVELGLFSLWGGID
jgi:uncharacterized coiled-coil protein SlyX